MFGQVRSEVPAYASSGLWLSYSIDELLEEADRFIQQGFRSVKLRVDGQVERDADRAHALRDALGDDIEILVDANQALTVDTAIALARALERYNIGWFEEPVLHSDLDAQRIVREASPIPIAGGETDYTCVGMRRILDANCTDVLMPDLQRIGGLTEMRNAAKLAASYNTPISTHIFTEYSLSIAASSKNCISVEHVDWYEGLFSARSNQTVRLRSPRRRDRFCIRRRSHRRIRILIAQLIDSSRVRHVPMHLGRTAVNLLRAFGQIHGIRITGVSGQRDVTVLVSHDAGHAVH